MYSSNFADLADLITRIDIKEIHFRPSEAKALFDLSEPSPSIEEFYWNIEAGYIKGRINDQPVIYPPRVLIAEYVLRHMWNDKYAVMMATLDFIADKLSDDELLNKLQLIIAERYKYVSMGQAISLIKRTMSQTLSSSERNDISKLRKKVDDCKKLVAGIESLLEKSSSVDPPEYADPELIYGESRDIFVAEVQSALYFVCVDCKEIIPFEQSDKPLASPEHCSKPMGIKYNPELDVIEVSASLQELNKAVKLGKKGLKKAEPIKINNDQLAEINRLIKELKTIFDNIEDKIDPRIKPRFDHAKEALYKLKTGNELEYAYIVKVPAISRRLKAIEVLSRHDKEIINFIRKSYVIIRKLWEQIGREPTLISMIAELDRLTPVPEKHIPREFEIQLYCAVCKTYKEVDDDLRNRLFYSEAEEIIPLPECHGQEMQISVIEENKE